MNSRVSKLLYKFFRNIQVGVYPLDLQILNPLNEGPFSQLLVH